jgi:hypothetical protein
VITAVIVAMRIVVTTTMSAAVMRRGIMMEVGLRQVVHRRHHIEVSERLISTSRQSRLGDITLLIVEIAEPDGLTRTSLCTSRNLVPNF